MVIVNNIKLTVKKVSLQRDRDDKESPSGVVRGPTVSKEEHSTQKDSNLTMAAV